MQPYVYCATKNGQHDFFIATEDGTFYLFTQAYRKGVQMHFGKGIPLHKALDFGSSKRDSAIQRTTQKLPAYIRYVERECQVVILEQTRRKANKAHKKRGQHNMQSFSFYGEDCA